MDYLIICIAAFIGSLLTFFSGFGLGTLLVPVFGIFFPIELAILMTAIVHFMNNLFKLLLTIRHADRNIVLRFGIPSVIAALAGAWLFTEVSQLPPLLTYTVMEKTFSIEPVKLVIAFLLLIFSLLEMFPALLNFNFRAKHMLPAGGMLSGFFGGLSGHQGALRSAFLIKLGLSKETFIATGVAIACMVDFSRLSVYFINLPGIRLTINYLLLTAAVLAAFAGAYTGNRFLKKMTLKSIHMVVAAMLIVFALFLGAGII